MPAHEQCGVWEEERERDNLPTSPLPLPSLPLPHPPFPCTKYEKLGWIRAKGKIVQTETFVRERNLRKKRSVFQYETGDWTGRGK